MKKSLSLLITIVMLISAFVIPSIIAFAAENPILSFTEVETQAGSAVSMPLTISGNTGIAGMAVSLKYDTDIISVSSTKKGTLFSGFTTGKNYLWDESENVTSNGTLAIFTFEVAAKAAPGDYDIEIIVRSCTDEDFNDVTVSTVSGRITVRSNECQHKTTKTVGAKDASCAEVGYTGDIVCTVCEEVIIRGTAIAKLAHTEVTVNAVPATCSQSGYTGDIVCSVCDTVIAKGTTIATIAHTASESIHENEKAATCTVAGSYEEVVYCSVCKIEISRTQRTIAKLAHTETPVNETDATCTEPGYTGDTVCSLCGEIIAKGESLPMFSHNYSTPTVKKATLTANGYTLSTCSICGAEKKTTIYMPKTFTLSATKMASTGKALTPTVTVKDSKGKVIAAKYYTVTYKNNTAVGTASVILKFKGNYSGTKTLNFSIVPAKVTGLKTSEVKKNSIKLTWSKASGAKYYRVQWSTDGKKWKTVNDVTGTTCTVLKLTTGKSYQFRVIALDSTKKITGSSSAVLKTATQTAAPSITLKSSKSKTAVATWKKVTGASKYVVYKSTDGKKWTKVTTTTKLTYTLKKLTSGKKVYVKVTAVNAYGTISAASAVKNVTVKK